ncbi:HD domain-containing protein [Candidatus Woesearchaeota archaeon]|jgi:putative nucleotidyltransferase with HDIG domain|nr:HD domain-containing protein [Candidatus Woesearchaeota archaeon]MBT4111062.1 HD domain-containing protein [Candidatus Woesearchaeota archaeon]MBT4336931.1 HD domain-containing protein [Candidatus Woesearchaeota archaeon]MBT4469754.1 HD domain-containing protein [Candidatus Woesearchaeota archaeon]MBT6743775.1 HD domain-containing protein [Candidatus Woesearchaeota archaeon]
MVLPTEEEVVQLQKYYRFPNHLLNHVKTVKKVVLFLAKGLNKKGDDYNLDLLSVGAELHDIAKPLTFPRQKPGEAEKFGWDPVPEESFEFWEEEKKKFPENYLHTEMGAEILKDYPELAEVVLNHALNDILHSDLSKEAILLNYADKIAMRKVVTLEQRFAYLKERYGISEEKRKYFNRYKEIEKEIFNKLGFPAEELAQRIENE